MAEHLPPEALDDWVAHLATELGVDPAAVPIGRILDLTGDVARGVARPAAPVSAFVIGLAVGAGLGDVDALARRTSELAADWRPEAG
ncbi:hypothetical protein GB864_14950 [Agromyces sp. MMS17-SY077]|uniref:DUF6457 domain-containing protein n=2 Tax=Agromyces seonyuensis TaxID=2662446 RepID=A0A6I4P7L9_9MICO|nr:hypothetical protein [Agromyces seonyuensis]